MRTLEQRLRQAAEETRQLARSRPPRQIQVEMPRRHRGLAVFAAAFAVVVLTFGLVPWLAGVGERAPLGDSTPSTQPATMTSTTLPDTTIGTSSGDDCPDGPAPEDQPGLPAAVAETRQALISAASTCDIGRLEDLADERFTTSFGGGGAANLEIWNDRGLAPTVTLLNLLDMRHTVVVVDGGPDIYVWPVAYGHQTWDQVTEEDLDELARIHTEAELDLFASGGAYHGWRTGIDEDGNWMFFVAGD